MTHPGDERADTQEPLFHEPATDYNAAKKNHRGENLLNDLDPKEWLLATKSVWYQRAQDLECPDIEPVTRALVQVYGVERAESVVGQLVASVLASRPPARDSEKVLHPATFAEPDIEKLIRFFTKEGDTVLDPFLGSGSTLVACRNTNRHGIGIELIPNWVAIAKNRLQLQPGLFETAPLKLEVVHGDARTRLQDFPENSFGFVVTSPPYWSMLNKRADHKVKRERLTKSLPTRYSTDSADLANVANYSAFLAELRRVFRECFRVLQDRRYIAVVVSDFRDGERFYFFHADIANILEHVGFRLAGLTILVQDSKNLYPYGMPHAFVSNIHHQFVVIARKNKARGTAGRGSRRRKPR